MQAYLMTPLRDAYAKLFLDVLNKKLGFGRLTPNVSLGRDAQQLLRVFRKQAETRSLSMQDGLKGGSLT